MKKILVILVTCFLIFSCSSKKKDQEKQQALAASPDFNPLPGQEIEQASVRSIIVIKSLKFTPESPTLNDDITATPVLENPDEDVGFTYRWFVNDKELPGVTANRLQSNLFTKKDWIYCIVTAEKGEEKADPFRSELIQIANILPVIEPMPLGVFRFPGLFTYQIRATDADGDMLRYELVSPTGLGIEVNPVTGLIQWNITPELLPTLPATMDIRYRVVDTSDGSAEGFITLSLPKG